MITETSTHYRAINGHLIQTVASLKSVITDVCHTFRNIDVCQFGTVIEGLVTNTADPIRDFYGRHIRTEIEGVIAYKLGPFFYGIGRLGLIYLLNQICVCISDVVNNRQAGAVGKRRPVYGFHTIGNLNRGQFWTSIVFITYCVPVDSN